MRSIILHKTTLLVVTVLLLSGAAMAAPTSATAAPPLAGASSDWFAAAQKNIAASEYHIHWQADIGAYQSPNRAQGIRVTYFADGFHMAPRVDSSADWSVDLRLTAIARGAVLMRPAATSSVARTIVDNRLTVSHDGFDIEYLNTEEGMRQNFLVKRRLAGDGPLALTLACSGSLSPVSKGDGDVLFVQKNRTLGTVNGKVWYKDLKAWDALGAPLEARMVVRDNAIVIAVNDRAAAYPITVDPLSATADWSAESNQAGASLGFSVAGAGDVNGDGYSDIIVGAPLYDSSFTDEGATFLYLGSASGPSTTPGWVAYGRLAGARFGQAVATAGDVNNDGYSDVIVGAPFWTNGQANEGQARVYLGSAGGLSTTAAWTFESDKVNAKFGFSVACAGDVNADGYSDIIVGANTYDSTQAACGKVYVFHGSSGGLSATASWVASPNYNQNGANAGASVAGAGDVNGDGYSDIVVGAPGYTNGQASEGRALVYLGSSTGVSAAAPWTAESNLANALFGTSVASAGDVNGDGYSDIIIGAPGYTNGEAGEGRAFVYLGSNTGVSAAAPWTAEANQANAGFGGSVACAGDVNGDGYSDVVVGAQGYDGAQTNSGRTYVYQGSAAGLPASANWTVDVNQMNASSGYCVASAGDVNGDGFSDVIVGAPYYDNPEVDEGRALVYYGSATGLAAAAAWSSTETNHVGDQLGYSVSSAGDVNGDGFADVIVGVPYYDAGAADAGAAFVYHGSLTGLPGAANRILSITQANAHFGTSVAAAGDVDGDGYGDVIVGAPDYDTTGRLNAGKVYVFSGSAGGIPAGASWVAYGSQANEDFGAAVGCAGDVNGDGYADVIVGAPLYDGGQTDEGRVYVYHGSSSGLPTVPTWTEEPNQAGAQFGRSVGSAGDVNGDGFSDIIIGSPLYDDGQTDEGLAFVYLGSAAGLPRTSAWIGMCDQAGAHFGQSVAGAGDVNGDGYSDVVVGAPEYSNGESREGAVFVYQGSSSGLSATATRTIESNETGAKLGISVASAGDVDGDGYSDIIVGADSSYNGETYEGRAFVFAGSATGTLATAAWTGESNTANAGFGRSVAGAGDINGDGYADVIVGAPDYTNGQSQEGRAYVYYGNGGSGLHSNARQYRSDLSTPVAPLGYSQSSGSIGLGLFGKSFLGRQKGKLAYEYKANGSPYSGAPVARSADSTGAQASLSDLTGSGVQLSQALSGIAAGHSYKWRARVRYSKATAITGQVNGPWRYMPTECRDEAGFKSSNMGAPNPPLLALPADSAHGVSTGPTLSWSASAGATSYTLQVSTDPAFGTFAYNQSGLSATSQAVSALAYYTRYYWRVQGANGNGNGAWSAVRTFLTAPATPNLSSPADGATGVAITPTLSWNPISGATQYRVQASTVATFASTVLNQLVGVSDFPVSGLANSTLYYWRVNANDGTDTSAWSSVRSFTTIIDTPDAPLLSAPTDNATSVTLGAALDWAAAARAATYNVQVSLVVTFATTVVNQSGIAATSYSPAGLLNDSTYYWRVSAANAGGTSPWSTVWHFRTIIAAPPAPTLNTPVDAASNQRADTLLLMWNSAVRATSYRLQVATDTAFGVPFANDPAAVSPYRLTGLATNTTYYWRVNASNIGGTGPWSTRWYFVTRPGVMDVPVLVSPAQGATGVATPVGLVWRATASALNYKVQISTNPGFSANVDSLSGITDTFVTPASISYNTLYYWRACAVFSGGQGNWSASRSFTTGPGAADVPRLVSPDSASCGADLYPTLTWRRPAGALAYTFQLSRNAGFTDLVVNETGIAPTDTVYGATPLLDSNQSYYWRVNATTAGGTTAWSSAWSFATLSSAPDVPLLVAPAHQATDVALNTALRWGTAARAAGYLLQVSAAAGFSPLVVSDSSLVDTVRVAAGLSNGTKYYWRVKAVNCSAQSLWSAVREFTTIVALPGQVALAAPTDADTLGSDSCLAVWQSASPAVTRYSLEYATDVSMTSPITDTTITDTTRVLRGLSDNTVYWWRVRARNAAGWGPFSQTRSFRVLIPLRATTPQAFDMRVAGATGSADAIRYALPQRVHVSLLIYDLLGKMALRAVEREQAAGYYRASLAGLPVGRYVVRFRAGEYAVQRMVALVR